MEEDLASGTCLRAAAAAHKWPANGLGTMDKCRVLELTPTYGAWQGQTWKGVGSTSLLTRTRPLRIARFSAHRETERERETQRERETERERERER